LQGGSRTLAQYTACGSPYSEVVFTSGDVKNSSMLLNSFAALDGEKSGKRADNKNEH
jgi:hypothetical protein